MSGKFICPQCEDQKAEIVQPITESGEVVAFRCLGCGFEWVGANPNPGNGDTEDE